MKTQNLDLQKGIQIILFISLIVGLVGVKYYGSIDNLYNAVDSSFRSIYNLSTRITSLDLTTFYLVSMIFIKLAIGWILFFLIYKLLKKTVYFISKEIDKITFIKGQKIEIETLLLEEVQYDLEKIDERITILNKKLIIVRKYNRLNNLEEEIKKQIKHCVRLLVDLKKDKKIIERKKELEWMEKRSLELNEEINIKESYDITDRKMIIYKLKAKEKNVFKKDKLSKKQIKALENNGFKQRTEFSLFEKKIY
jgi:hypothetical protein